MGLDIDKTKQGEIVDECINLFHLNGERRLPHEYINSSLLAYYNDTRNQDVLPESIQRRVAVSKGGIYTVGKIDQIRVYKGIPEIWEIKFSRMQPLALVQMYLPQLIMYAEGLGVAIGGICNVYNYCNKRPVMHYIKSEKAVYEYSNFIWRELGK